MYIYIVSDWIKCINVSLIKLVHLRSKSISPPRTKWLLTAAKGLVWKSCMTEGSRCKGFFTVYLGMKRFVSFLSFEVKQTVQLKRSFSVEKFARF